MMKIASFILCSFLICSFHLLAKPKGKGFDVIYPVPVSDPDIYHDDGSVQVNLAFSMLGDRSTTTFHTNYALKKFNDNSILSFNFIYFDYSFSKNRGSADGRETSFGLNYNRSIFKTFEGPESSVGGGSWVPSKHSLSWFTGLAFSSSEITVSADTTGVIEQHPDLFIARGSKFLGETTGFPVSVGLIYDWSMTRRHGFETYAHFHYDIELSDEGYKGSTAPVLNGGFNYYYRKKATYFPFEWTSGLIFTGPSNDIDNSASIAVNFGFRKHW